MGVKDIVRARRLLKNAGYNLNNPKECATRTIQTIVYSSVPSVMSKEEMVKFLDGVIEKVKSET